MFIMKQRFIINMQNIDNLDDLAIELAPFTIFTGDNNSGKTTIMNIIYGIFRLSEEIISKGDKSSSEYLLCKEYIRELKENREGHIDSSVGNMFCDFFNRSLLGNKDYFFNKIFNISIDNNYQRFESSKIFLSNYKIFPKVYISLDDDCDEILIEGDYVRIPTSMFEDEDSILELICNKIIEDGFRDTNLSKSIFIPSGRSSFLCYADLFKTIKYQNLSINDFIDNVQNLECVEKKGIYSNISKFIEENILRGVVTKDSYKGDLNNIEIPICMASDSIRELASFVLFLKAKERFTSFFIEEVESHLDLRLQRSIVSALIRVVNSGTSIFMSTNSSVILDQICNFILLNNLNRHKIEGFGYIINDVLNASDINIYEFSYGDNKVNANKLDVNYDGFKSSIAEDILEDISKENIQLKFEMFDNNGNGR